MSWSVECMDGRGGYPIVFTSNATEMSDFMEDPFRAFMGGFSKIFAVLQGYPPVEYDLSDLLSVEKSRRLL